MFQRESNKFVPIHLQQTLQRHQQLRVRGSMQNRPVQLKVMTELRPRNFVAHNISEKLDFKQKVDFRQEVVQHPTSRQKTLCR